MSLLAPQERRQRPEPQDDAAAPVSAAELHYQQDAANYVSAMVAELRQIAAKAGFGKLVTALDAAYYEAYGAIDPKARAGVPEKAEKNSKGLEPKSSDLR
jgi:hypothetical protein